MMFCVKSLIAQSFHSLLLLSVLCIPFTRTYIHDCVALIASAFRRAKEIWAPSSVIMFVISLVKRNHQVESNSGWMEREDFVFFFGMMIPLIIGIDSFRPLFLSTQIFWCIYAVSDLLFTSFVGVLSLKETTWFAPSHLPLSSPFSRLTSSLLFTNGLSFTYFLVFCSHCLSLVLSNVAVNRNLSKSMFWVILNLFSRRNQTVYSLPPFSLCLCGSPFHNSRNWHDGNCFARHSDPSPERERKRKRKRQRKS